MKIYSARTVRTEKWVRLKVSHGVKAFEISVLTVDGKLKHSSHKQGIATSYLTYFNEVPEKTRKKHYEEIKKYVERHIK
jgi:hypothetical protein